ncbi:urease accessory UreF family protein, partial [Streptomyces sp. NPDC059762]|uniref:urease accessory UreF family protein n=1 Tax=Streptomyces sp. NPDC059762 TaxID=3346938 RepID=UPI003668D1D8
QPRPPARPPAPAPQPPPPPAAPPRPPPHPPDPAPAPRAAGLGPEDAAHCAAYETVGGPATATVRLLGLDPYQATGVLARLAPAMDEVARRAPAAAREGVDALPAASAPLLDITAEQHAAWPVRLFAS